MVDALDPAADAPRRVAFVITRSDAVGGAQLHVQLLARALLDAGHAAHVFVGGEGPWCRWLEASGVPHTSLRHLKNAVRPWVDGPAYVEVLGALRDFSPDLVSTHSTKAGWLGRGAARQLGLPIVHTQHGQLFSYGAMTAPRRVVRLAERWCARTCGAILFVSHYDRRVGLHHGIGLPHQHAVVHNAIPDNALQADPVGTIPQVLMVARLARPKDPLLALDAFARIAKHPWHFTIAGDGPLRPAVEARIDALGLRDRVTMAGTVDDVPQRLAAAQVFLLASRREGFPMSVLEAMRAGLPVVTTDAGGVSEAVIDGATGLVTPRDDVPALARALESVVTDADQRRRMGAAGRARFLAEFGFERHVRRVWAVYRRAMRETP
ncbi:MAG: glycosyltransferase family 4 protein [Nannocystaceae bacterium]|nr:glycosyltransferase family 4 protein [bacterium]